MLKYIKQVSKKFKSQKSSPVWLVQFLPVEEQIKVIRKALGISQVQLAKKLGFSSNVPIVKMEKGQIENPTIDTLKKYAEALGCELLVRFVPKKEIEKMVEEQAEKKAREIVSLSVGNSAMELQKPDDETIKEEIEKVKEELLEKRRSVIWEE
jgi:predicted DNA-binding mobile mystery protein A